MPALGLDLLLGLPDGTLGSTNRRVTAGIGYVVGAAVGAGLVAAGTDASHWPVALEVIVAVVVGLGLSNARYRRTRGPERQRMQWFGWALAVTTEATLICLGLRVLIGSPAPALALLATVPIPVALAVGSSPRMIGRIDRILAHTVAVAGLTGVVTACYVVIVIGLGRVPDRSERGLLTLSMVAAGVAALLYLPARDRLGRFANKLVYGERDAPDEALRTFGSRLSRAIPMDELMLQLAESLRKTLVLDRAEVWTGTAERLEITASVPERKDATPLTLSATEAPVVARAGVSGPAWLKVWLSGLLEGREDHVMRVAPVTHSGELLGLIVADRGSGGDAFGEEEERVLTERARQVGLALHNVQLDSALQASLDQLRHQAAELQASRARLVAAGDAERRKIERNLHDGAQQHLVALAVNLRLTKTLAERDPSKAAEMLDQLTSDVQETLQELRALAHGIYPPLLMDRGLTEALNAAAGRAALATTVEADDVGRYHPDVEAAVYFFCLEALQNAGKHAGEDAEAVVKVWREDGLLRFSVSDNGAGFDAKDFTGGAGFTNLSDRLGAIGGSFHLDTAPGKGTKLEGWIPADPLPAPAS
jgi:signal transduction histidine kinase